MSLQLLTAACAVFAGCLVLSRILSSIFARSDVVAIPNARSSHAVATPVGVGVVVPLAAASALAVLAGPPHLLLVSALLFAALGLLDDVFALPAILRLMVQCAIAVMAVLLLDPSSPAFAGAVVLALVAAVNGLNFMDGINGITSTLGIVIGLTLAVAADHVGSPDWQVLGIATAAACLGYLPHNFPIARSFPGDVLPYWLASVFVLGIVDMSRSAPLVLFGLSPLVPSFLDTSSTLIARAKKSERLLSGHRDHVYQRYADATSHAEAALCFSGLALGCGLALPMALAWGPWVGLGFLSCASAAAAVVLVRIARVPS